MGLLEHILKVHGKANLEEIKNLIFLSSDYFLNQELDVKKTKFLKTFQEKETLYGIGEGIRRMTGLKPVKLLETLYIENSDITRIEGLESVVSLRRLYLINGRLPKIEGLEKSVNLEELDVSSNPLEQEALEKILEYKQRGLVPKLKRITMKGTNINWKNDSVKKIIKELRKKYKLKIISDQQTFERDKFENPAKLYIILGPSGAGKTEIIRRLKEELGVIPLKKTTTRNLRPRETLESIRYLEGKKFAQLVKEGEIIQPIFYMGEWYGIQKSDFTEASQKNKNYIIDTCDATSALKLRDAHPHLVKVIALIPNPYLIESGLTERLRIFEKEINQSIGELTPPQDRPNYKVIIEYGIANTLQRIKQIEDHNKSMGWCCLYVDHSIEGSSWERNYQQVKSIIQGKNNIS